MEKKKIERIDGSENKKLVVEPLRVEKSVRNQDEYDIPYEKKTYSIKKEIEIENDIHLPKIKKDIKPVEKRVEVQKPLSQEEEDIFKVLETPTHDAIKKQNKTLKERIFSLKTVAIALTGVALTMTFTLYTWYFNGDSQTKLIEEYKETQAVQVAQEKPKKLSKVSQKYPFVEVDFKKLQQKNKEVVAWLRVGAVDIDMPITQTDNNEYYLDHDVNRNKNSLGWVFADTRSSLEYLGDNTVLYGHNLTNQQMFGSLKDLFKTDPEKKEQDEIIQFTTQRQQMVFEIVSVYVTDFKDWKYVQQGFKGVDSKKKFVERIKSKNEMKLFERKDLSEKDQFLTFSTCYGAAGTTDRLVVHARMVASTNNI